jgi:tetratricopeptide (TPR) repeat protein
VHQSELEKLAEAQLVFEGLLGQSIAEYGADSEQAIAPMFYLGEVLVVCGRYKEAESIRRRLVELAMKLNVPLDSLTLRGLLSLGGDLINQGRGNEASLYVSEALGGRKKVLGERHPNALHAATQLSCCMPAKKLADAVQLAREATADLLDTAGEDHEYTYEAMKVLGGLLWKQGKFDEAEIVLRNALEIGRRKGEASAPSTSTNMEYLALVLRDKGLLDEAEKYANIIVAGRINRHGSQHPHVLTSINLLRSRLGFNT